MNTTDFEGTTVSGETGTYHLGEKLGGGREGSVYRIVGSDSSVVKIFEDGYRSSKAPKVRAMINNPPQDPTYNEEGSRSIVWPTELVRDRSEGQFIGYKMPFKDLDEVKNALHYAMVDLKWDNSTEKERFTTALNLAIMVHAIHQQGHAIGDFNHENILIDDGYVTLIDCDGFHISGSTDTYKGDTFLPRYSPPESRGKRLSVVRKVDRFGLGVHIFQLLMEGNHPFLAQGPGTADGDSGRYDSTESVPIWIGRPRG